MGTTYDIVHDVFIEKITDYDIADLTEYQVSRIFDKYLNSSCKAFNHLYKGVDLSRDSNIKEFAFDLDGDIIEILAIGMVYYWINPKVLSTDNLKNVMKTRDFIPFSPAELLVQLKELRKQVQRDFRNSIIEYTYAVGDVGGDPVE